MLYFLLKYSIISFAVFSSTFFVIKVAITRASKLFNSLSNKTIAFFNKFISFFYTLINGFSKFLGSTCSKPPIPKIYLFPFIFGSCFSKADCINRFKDVIISVLGKFTSTFMILSLFKADR